MSKDAKNGEGDMDYMTCIREINGTWLKYLWSFPCMLTKFHAFGFHTSNLMYLSPKTYMGCIIGKI